MLREQHGDIATALYETYMHFRGRFIEERGLMDAVPGVGEIWAEALADACALRDHVTQRWADLIVAAQNCGYE
jgi:hypothetical protein